MDVRVFPIRSYLTYGQLYCVILIIYSRGIQLAGKRVSVFNHLMKNSQ